MAASQGFFHFSFMKFDSMFPSLRSCAVALVLLTGLWGCSSGLDAIVATARRTTALGSDLADSPRLDPRFQYLRTTSGGRVAYLAQGYVEPASDGPIGVWYSGDREVLKFQQGRLVGAAGLSHEWRNVRFNGVPGWDALLKSDGEKSYTRYRDVMPGYRLGVEDQLSIRRIAQPKRTALRGMPAESLTWFQEQQVGGAADMALPPAIYGVEVKNGAAEVVYGEQCIAKELCFTWQRWAVTP